MPGSLGLRAPAVFADDGIEKTMMFEIRYMELLVAYYPLHVAFDVSPRWPEEVIVDVPSKPNCVYL